MYRVADAILVRAATNRPGAVLPDWPDLTGSTSQHVARWRRWLEQIWPLDGLGDAIEVASPVLARQARKVIDGHILDPRPARRIVMSVARYVLRASGRATPFGLFAGIAPASFGDLVTVRWGDDHQARVRPGAEGLAAAVTSLEACPELLDRLPVTVSDLCIIRGGRFVAAAQQHIGPADGTEQARPVEVSVRLTKAVEAVIRYARTPVVSGDLAAKLSTEFPRAPVTAIKGMIAELVQLRLLITSLRAPMTVTDVLGHLVGELDAAGVLTVPQAAVQARALRAARIQAARHDKARPAARRELRLSVARYLSRAGCTAEPGLSVDVRLDAQIVLPHAVAREAEAAAAALTRLTPYPSGLPAWSSYHAAFIERYGPGTLVPLLDLTNPDTGLGFPATFHESARTLPRYRSPPAMNGLPGWRTQRCWTAAARSSWMTRRSMISLAAAPIRRRSRRTRNCASSSTRPVWLQYSAAISGWSSRVPPGRPGRRQAVSLTCSTRPLKSGSAERTPGYRSCGPVHLQSRCPVLRCTPDPKGSPAPRRSCRT